MAGRGRSATSPGAFLVQTNGGRPDVLPENQTRGNVGPPPLEGPLSQPVGTSKGEFEQYLATM